MDPLAALTSDPRVRIRRPGAPDSSGGCVVYWMQRAHRGSDNPALDVAVNAANLLGKPVVVYLAPVPFYPNANWRHYHFLAQGIPDIAAAAEKRNLGFVLRRYPDHSLPKFCEEVKPALVIGDENPLREPESWRQRAAKRLKVPLWTVDADVVVPSRLIEKELYAAFHMRRRMDRLLPDFLVASRNPKARVAWKKPRELHSLLPDFDILAGWELDRSAGPVSGFTGGASEAARLLKLFVGGKLANYGDTRNHPELEGTSRLSPYLHFGHIGPLTVALAVKHADLPQETKQAYLDQLLVWRELAINFVTYNQHYDSFECGPAWAHRTLAEHAGDPRPYLYQRRELEAAETHDPLWNAAQMQMVHEGWMHNYMRMYWAKKILEWSRTPAEAYRTAVYLNDKFLLDGRDPNGYAGIAWSLVGKFDRPWFERPIFGLIRYMSGQSTGRKFDSGRYIAQHTHPGLF